MEQVNPNLPIINQCFITVLCVFHILITRYVYFVHVQDDCYVEVDKLTDEIVEDMISRVANCTDHVQTVFLEQELVIYYTYHYYYDWLIHFSCKIPSMDDDRLLAFLNKVYHTCT